jgi:hypothetical protein
MLLLDAWGLYHIGGGVAKIGEQRRIDQGGYAAVGMGRDSLGRWTHTERRSELVQRPVSKESAAY